MVKFFDDGFVLFIVVFLEWVVNVIVDRLSCLMCEVVCVRKMWEFCFFLFWLEEFDIISLCDIDFDDLVFDGFEEVVIVSGDMFVIDFEVEYFFIDDRMWV